MGLRRRSWNYSITSKILRPLSLKLECMLTDMVGRMLVVTALVRGIMGHALWMVRVSLIDSWNLLWRHRLIVINCV